MSTSNTNSVRDPMCAAPRLRDDLICTPDLHGDPPCYVIEDPLRGKFFRVGVPEFTFLSLLDGETSIARASGLAAKRLGRQALAENECLAICRWAMDCQLAQTIEWAQADHLQATAEKNARRRLLGIINPLMIKVPLVNPDRFLTAVGPWCNWLLSERFFFVWFGTCLFAVGLLIGGWSRFTQSTAVILNRDNWLWLLLAWALLKLLHELAHALACKKYGGRVPVAGVTFLFFAPLAYVDVTSSWRFRSKWQRMATAAAGMYVELFAAAIGLIVWWNTSDSLVHHMALNIALMAGFNTLLFNGNPLVRFDGYFILSDWLEIPNLSPCGQQFIAQTIEKQILGVQPPDLGWPPRKAAIIKAYAVASTVWRVGFFLVLALGLSAIFPPFGGLLALVLLLIGWGVPMVQIVQRVVRGVACQPIDMGRLAAAAAISLGLVTVAALLLSRPGAMQSAAVFEYAPLTIVRAGAPGFVRELRVRNGDPIEPGQVIAVLENPELEAELADLRLAYEQSVLKGRIHYQEKEFGKCQVEQANREALEKKMAETRRQIAALTVRSPARGRCFARDFDTLQDRYLQVGDQMAVVGDETAKELLIAVYQRDVDSFLAQLGNPIDVRLRGATGGWFPSQLVSVAPRASVELPHPAFAAAVGGPLAVQAKQVTPQQASQGARQAFELLTPAFLAKAQLLPEQAALVHAGEMARVTFRSPVETVAGRMIRSIQDWMRRHTASRSAK